MKVNSPTPIRANPALPDHLILPPPTQGGDEHRDHENAAMKRLALLVELLAAAEWADRHDEDLAALARLCR